VEGREVGEERGAVDGDKLADISTVVFAGEPAVWDGEQEFAAGFEDAVDFACGSGEVGDMFQGFETHDGVEEMIAELHRGGGHLMEVEAGIALDFLPKGVEVVWLDVDAVDFLVAGGESEGECAVAAAEVQKALTFPSAKRLEF